MAPVILPFVTEDAYAEWADAPRRVIYEAEQVEGEPPLLFPERDRAGFGEAPLSYAFPPVGVTTLRHVVVRGKSNLLTPPEAVLRHGLVNLDLEEIPEELYVRLMVAREQGSAAWAPNDPFAVDYLDEAAVFADHAAFNYAHWLTEVLPRIAAYVRDGPPGVPLIVDSELHANIVRSIALVAPEARLYRLAPHELVRVGVLHKVSVAGYVPFKLRPQPVESIVHGLFGGQALKGAVAQVRAALPAPARSGSGDRPKLFIRRNAALRRIHNEPAVEGALVARGFRLIEPERLTFDEQVAAFSQARMVVGATGAAMANLIFCRPDCPTIVIMPRFRHTAYWYWRHMAAAAGAGPVIHVSGPQTSPTEDPFDPLAVHQDFEISVADVLEGLDAAEAVSG
jgi:capsular polysaccharide biosynthesis protein